MDNIEIIVPCTRTSSILIRTTAWNCTCKVYRVLRKNQMHNWITFIPHTHRYGFVDGMTSVENYYSWNLFKADGRAQNMTHETIGPRSLSKHMQQQCFAIYAPIHVIWMTTSHRNPISYVFQMHRGNIEAGIKRRKTRFKCYFQKTVWQRVPCAKLMFDCSGIR